jgi:DNA-binding response OmpR family regulator
VAHILIVEDDRLVLTGLANGLEALGYVASKASSGEQALEILDTVKPDLVVMDACLPGISGIETAKQILHAVCGSRRNMACAMLARQPSFRLARFIEIRQVNF